MSKRLQRLIERAKFLLEEPTVHKFVDHAPAYEVHVFDFDKTLHHKYKPLPCVEILKTLQTSTFDEFSV